MFFIKIIIHHSKKNCSFQSRKFCPPPIDIKIDEGRYQEDPNPWFSNINAVKLAFTGWKLQLTIQEHREDDEIQHYFKILPWIIFFFFSFPTWILRVIVHLNGPTKSLLLGPKRSNCGRKRWQTNMREPDKSPFGTKENQRRWIKF